MARKSTTDQQTDGDVLLNRLASTTLPAALKKVAADFKKTHTELETASTAARSARADRDLALANVGTADDLLDAAVNVLADKLAGAQMGKRKNAFDSFSKLAPGAVTELPYADEVKEVLSIVAKVKKAKPPADVAKAAATCEKLANGVSSALAKLTKPQLAYSKALASRDALLPSWTKSLNRLKKNAAAAWFDDEGSYKAMFAPPERVQAPVHAKKKSSAASKSTGDVKPPTLPPPAAVPTISKSSS